MNELTDEKQKEVYEAFEIFDSDKDNLVSLDEADSVFRCLGYNFDQTKLNKIMQDYGVTKDSKDSKDSKDTKYFNAKNYLTYKSIIEFLNRRNREFEIEDELLESFRSFDKDGDGKLNMKEMKYLLLTLGEQLDDEEVEEIISEIDTSGQGAIFYEDFVRMLMTK
jgi:Ca2+-binding EF-hand superfamily protein